MSFSQAHLFVYSGTGNTYRAACWSREILQQHNIPTQMSPIDVHGPTRGFAPNKQTLVGLFNPVHGFTAPWKVIKFTLRLPRGRGAAAFCLTSRAGLMVGRFHIPGLAGTSCFLLSLLLLLRGYRVLGAKSVNMPSNWYSLHPMQSGKTHQKILDRARFLITPYVEAIALGRRRWWTLNNFYELCGGLALSWLSLAYLFMGRFFLAKLFFANGDCNGCGLCAKICPVGAIKMWGDKTPRPFWKYNCESCMRCAAFCQPRAIEAGHSWAALLYFLGTIPVTTYLYGWLAQTLPWSRGLQGSLLGEVVEWLYALLALFSCYYLFHLLLRIPALNWLFSRTTLTHYWSRYREPQTKWKQLRPARDSVNQEVATPQPPLT